MTNQTQPTEAGMRSMPCSLLVYDVPFGCKCDHPSSVLWRTAARINMSAWIVPEERIPSLPRDEWTMAGVRWRMVRFHEADAEVITALAVEALMERVGERRDALDRGIKEVRAAYDAARAFGGEEREAHLDRAGRLASAHLRRARTALEEATECALAFSITGRVERAFEGMRKLVKAREAIYWEMDRDARPASTPISGQPDLGLEVTS
jgi:hypothetical protein